MSIKVREIIYLTEETNGTFRQQINIWNENFIGFFYNRLCSKEEKTIDRNTGIDTIQNKKKRQVWKNSVHQYPSGTIYIIGI